MSRAATIKLAPLLFLMPKKVVTRSSSVVAVKEHVATDLAGKTAILGLKNRTYYTFDDVSSPIWALIQTETRVEEIHRVMMRRYEVEPEQCERDLLAFLQILADENLIEVH